MGSLKQAFQDCQKTVASHPKLVKYLINTYLKSDLQEFLTEFTSLLKKSLIHGDKQPTVERTLIFVAKFATTKKETNDENVKANRNSEEEDEDEDDDEADPFLVNLIQFLLDNHEASSQAVRYRVCQLINKILNHMGEEAVIDDDLYNHIYDTMLHRLQDKVPVVRVQAVLAVARLQDPRNKECPVIKAYRYHLSMDPNPDVRRAVLSNIAITFQTLPDILERTRDVRDVVRRLAYQVISQKVHLRSLTIAQRVRLISEGLKDRSDMVRSAVDKHLLQAWLRMVNGNVLDLLTCLDVEASVTEAELALKTLFNNVPYPNLIESIGLDKDKRIINECDLRPESALYWRCLAQHLKNEGAEEALDTILPELTHFCTYLNDYIMTEVMEDVDPQDAAVRCMEREFVTQQLITMSMLYDYSDEVGRRSLDNLVRSLFVSDKVGEALMKGLVEVFGKLHPPTSRINQLAEIISEVREPVMKSVERPLTDVEKRKKKMEAAKLKVKINQLREEVEDCVRSLDLNRAQSLKDELQSREAELSLINFDTDTAEEHLASLQLQKYQEERSDPATLGKCLVVICHAVENPDITVMTPTLHSLHENLVLPCLRSADPAIRNHAVGALGLFCLLSKDLASQHLILFMQISRIDVEQIKLQALRCLIDLLHLYGIDEFTDAAEDITDVAALANSPSKEQEFKEFDEEDGGAIISALCHMMDDESSEVRTLAAEGLCKLLLASRITSSKLLSHLILMWYNPATEDDSLLRHMLGVFFPFYASFGGSNQESLCAAVLPTLKTLFNAPARSPLADVDVDDVANFLVSITNPTIVAEGSTEQINSHDTLVFSLCSEILAFPDSCWNKVLIRCLNHLSLTPTNYSTLRQVDVLAAKLIEKVKDKKFFNGLDRFHNSIQNLLKNAPEPEPEVKTEETTENDVFEDSVNSVAEKVLENTAIRKKRMLYNSQNFSDVELFSEVDSDSEVIPNKRLAFPDDIADIGSPQITSTQKNNEATDDDAETGEGRSDAVVRVNPAPDTEIELTPKPAENKTTEGTSYPDLPSSGTKKSPKKQRKTRSGNTLQTPSTPSQEPSDIDSPNGSSPASGGKRSKNRSSTAGESSDGEVAVPSKVARRLRTNKNSKSDGAQSSPNADVSQVTPNSGGKRKGRSRVPVTYDEDASSDSSESSPNMRNTGKDVNSSSSQSSPNNRKTRRKTQSKSNQSSPDARSTRKKVRSDSGQSTSANRSTSQETTSSPSAKSDSSQSLPDNTNQMELESDSSSMTPDVRHTPIETSSDSSQVRSSSRRTRGKDTTKVIPETSSSSPRSTPTNRKSQKGTRTPVQIVSPDSSQSDTGRRSSRQRTSNIDQTVIKAQDLTKTRNVNKNSSPQSINSSNTTDSSNPSTTRPTRSTRKQQLSDASNAAELSTPAVRAGRAVSKSQSPSSGSPATRQSTRSTVTMEPRATRSNRK